MARVICDMSASLDGYVTGLPCTSDRVVENTTFGSAFQIAANSSVE
jgi:hypothetical protein